MAIEATHGETGSLHNIHDRARLDAPLAKQRGGGCLDGFARLLLLSLLLIHTYPSAAALWPLWAKCLSSISDMNSLGLDGTPTIRSTSCPFLKRIRVGMPLIPKLAMPSPFSSTFILSTFALPWYFSAIASTVGAIRLQGPHHSAQKSTRTGSEDFKTSASKASAFTSFTNILIISPFIL